MRRRKTGIRAALVIVLGLAVYSGVFVGAAVQAQADQPTAKPVIPRENLKIPKPMQASKVDESTLKGWIKDNRFPFPVGMLRDDAEKIRFAWGVRSLPWLLLTDRNHVVTAEGFAVSEMGDKLE